MDNTTRRLRLARIMLMGSIVIFVLGIVVRILPLPEEDIAKLLSHIIICYAGTAVAFALFLRNIVLFCNRPRVHMWAIVLDITLLCLSIVFKVMAYSQDAQQMYTICDIIFYVAFALLAILMCVEVVRMRNQKPTSNTEQDEASDNTQL